MFTRPGAAQTPSGTPPKLVVNSSRARAAPPASFQAVRTFRSRRFAGTGTSFGMTPMMSESAAPPIRPARGAPPRARRVSSGGARRRRVLEGCGVCVGAERPCRGSGAVSSRFAAGGEERVHLPERRPGQVRIGVALQIPPPYSTVLSSVRAEVGDPLARAIPPHVTLLGPTVLDRDRMPEVTDHLAEVAGSFAPFVMGLKGAGTFRPVSPVVFVNLVRGWDECAALQDAVRRGPLAQE